MLCLPDEILVDILNNLHYVREGGEIYGRKNDLLSTRVVCKRLACVGVDLAFRHIKFIQDQEGYSRLRALSKSHHRTSVHHLSYCFEDFTNEALSREEYDWHFRAYAGPRRYELYKTDDMYKDFCRGREYQAHLQSSNLDVAHLSVAFSLLEDLRSIHISQIFTERSGPWHGASLAVGALAFLGHPVSCRVFDTITTSLCATDTKIKALTWMSNTGLNALPLTGIIQGLSLSKTAMYREAFGQLESLDIHLPADTNKIQINFEGLSAFICSLPMLAKLVICGTKHVHTKLEPSFLATLDVPRLRSIAISSGIFASPSNLAGFFSRHSKSLQHVKLHNVALENGSWEGIFYHMRDTLSLRSSDMTGKFCNDDPYEPGSVEIGYGVQYHGIPALPGRAIEDFIERRTDVSPFDLDRASGRRYPEHSSADDQHLCLAGVCPYLCTPAAAEEKLMRKRTGMMNDKAIYVLSRYDVYTLSVIFRRQGRTREAELLEKLALRREKTRMRGEFQYCEGLLSLRGG